MSYKFLPHTADICFLVRGKTLEEVFLSSAKALRNSLTTKKIKEKFSKKIKLTSENIESLLYLFLEEILFLYEANFFIMSKIKEISIKEKGKKFFLEAILIGDNTKNYNISNPIKAVTYNQMKIERVRNNFQTRIVLDA